jgi:hypothetical protein
MKNIKHFIFMGVALFTFNSCNRSKPKPISKDITKTTVTVNGKKDSVINNPEKNYGYATVPEPCVKCLLLVIQKTDSYEKLTSAIPPQNIIYEVNWITSSHPIDIGDGSRIINGMAINVNLKGTRRPINLTTYLYNNENARLYLLNKQNKFDGDVIVSDTSLKKIRNSCFWGVASAK